MIKYRKKPVVIEAIQFTGHNGTEVEAWMIGLEGERCGTGYDKDIEKWFLTIETLEGVMKAEPGDWIIHGVKGEFYPCKPDIFEATYDDIFVEAPSHECCDRYERVVSIGSARYTRVVCLDKPGAGNACHVYGVESIAKDEIEPVRSFARVSFQNGPIRENGVNGCHQEDLIAIVIDRLRSFQAGEFACHENALALTKLEEALQWLNHRTSDRQARGVEGTSIK